MSGAMQDDELWRRAFSTNAGLFFDTPALDGLGLPGDVGAGLADRVPLPAPTTHNDSNVNVDPLASLPAMELAAPAALQQRHQHHQQPVLRVQVRGRLVEDRPTQPPPTLPPPPQQQQRILLSAPAANVPVLGAATAAIALPAASPATNEPSHDQDTPNLRGGESFTRKRDRAKLLRQQMNDGLDNLHEALVEVSTSGANPSASAATNLIPTRGPRRAAVVACSAGLVRELISTCVSLRAEKASVSERLSAALATVAVLQQQRQQQQAAGGSLASPAAAGLVAEGAAAAAAGQLAAEKRRDDGTARGGSGGAAAEVSAKVFGQLLSLSVFGFLGPQSLREGRKVSREWRDKCTWDCNWSNLCVSRWRLGPEQRHAEVWRAPDRGKEGGTVATRTVVSPPVPPPSWRSIYSRLHRKMRVPTGALSPSHTVVGRSTQEGVAIWIALSRRSNGMTGRSVMGHGSAGFRTTEVIELRAVVQRVEEGQAVRVHPRAFAVRQVSGMRAYLRGSGSCGSTGAGGIVTTTGVFPPVSRGEDMFSPRFVVNTGAGVSGGGGNSSNSATGSSLSGGGGGAGTGSWLGTVAQPAAQVATPPLALYEYAAVDFFIEAAGCPTEADFLRREACVDVAVSGAAAGGAPQAGRGGGDAPRLQVLSVGLTEVNSPPPAAFGLHAMGVGIDRPVKRRF